MSYYNYRDEYYTTYLDLGVVGEAEVEVCVDIEIPYKDVIKEMGDDVWAYVDDGLVDYVLDKYKDYLPEILENACEGGLDDLCVALVDQLRHDKREAMLAKLIKLANEFILEINDVEQLALKAV